MRRHGSSSRQTLKSKDKSTKMTMFHKSVGRQIKPTWGNRICKDFYDLDYDVQTDLFAKNNKFKKAKGAPYMRNNKLQKNLSSIKKRSLQLPNRNSSFERQKLHRSNLNPETIQIGQFPSKTSKFMNLSPFQYQKTIQGKLAKKKSYHLNFDKQKVNRQENVNQIYYNRHVDIDFSYPDTLQLRHLMKQYHPFQSYTQRRVFQPRQELDKIYDTDGCRKKATFSHIKQTVPLQKIMQRTQKKPSESQTLSYQIQDGLRTILTTPRNYSIEKAQRNIVFKRQVINDKRGCFR